LQSAIDRALAFAPTITIGAQSAWDGNSFPGFVDISLGSSCV
jgi:hypothetical protein